jgi:hypothetical protein
MKYLLVTVAVGLVLFVLTSLLYAQKDSTAKSSPYISAPIKNDLSKLTAKDRETLYYLVKASTFMDRIFFLQTYANNQDVWETVKKNNGQDKEFVRMFFEINFGPFDRLDNDHPFFGDKEKPKGAGFYPENMTKEEFTAFVAAHPEQKDFLESPYTVIVRTNDGFKAVPYPQVYGDLLKGCVAYLNKAAEVTDNTSLKKYLQSRAQDLLTNDYFVSDCNWLDINGNQVELVIGPYEVYEDGLFNYKASYESFVYINDLEESGKVQAFISYLKEMQKNLPVDKKYLAENIGSMSPLKVADLVFSAGDCKAGVNTIAFALPNDEKVRELKGSKKIILQNIMEAKYHNVLLPIAKNMIAAEQIQFVAFKPFLYHVILHELSHALGSDYIAPQQDKISVRKALKDIYSTMEEAKADAMGLYNAILMIDKKVIPENLRQAMFVTQLASMFRSMRFGIEDAHGGSNLIQFNYLKEKGGVVEKDGYYAVDGDKFPPALTSLVKDILEIQGIGDYERAKAWVAQYAKLSDDLKAKLATLKVIPVDVKLEFETVHELGKQNNDTSLNQDRYFD